jgi:5-methylcytosine-specific restriction enzyme subunit McrC
MFAYNLYWDADRSMLLYPTSKLINTEFGKFHKGKTSDNLCKLGFVNVIDSKGNLNLKIGNEIIELMGINN